MNNENLQKWALLAEVVSACAVIATLIILILEVRENSEVIRGTAYQDFRSQVNQAVGYRLENPDLAIVWDKGLSGMSKLNDLEKRQFSDMIFMIVGNWESGFYLQEAGIFDASMGAGGSAVTDTLGFREWWESRKDGYNDSFQQYIENRIQ